MQQRSRVPLRFMISDDRGHRVGITEFLYLSLHPNDKYLILSRTFYSLLTELTLLNGMAPCRVRKMVRHPSEVSHTKPLKKGPALKQLRPNQ